MPRVDTWQKELPVLKVEVKKKITKLKWLKELWLMVFYLERTREGHVKNDLYSAQSDFIYASSIEEFGSIFGGLGLVIMYTILFFRSIRIMNKTESLFGAYVVFGLSFLLVFQSLINMGVGVNLFPVTGQPLPLISMGGTSIIFSCVALGIIINVSRTVYKDA